MNERILIVTGDAEIGQSLEQNLATLGYQSCAASTQKDALILLFKTEFDLLLLDVDVQGFEVIRLIRETHCSIPVIAVSGGLIKGNLVEAIRYGCGDFLNKTCELSELKDSITRTIKKQGHRIEKKLSELNLTLREREIARLVSQGKSNKSIAKRLNIVEQTTKAHLQNIFRKSGFQTRTQFLSYLLIQ